MIFVAITVKESQAGEMAQWLNAYSPSEDQTSDPSTPAGWLTQVSDSSSRGPDAARQPLWAQAYHIK